MGTLPFKYSIIKTNIEISNMNDSILELTIFKFLVLVFNKKVLDLPLFKFSEFKKNFKNNKTKNYFVCLINKTDSLKPIF